MLATKLCLPLLAAAALLAACAGPRSSPGGRPDPWLAAQGQLIFRYDSFGDGALWSDKLRMHEVIASSVSPAVALALGLKLDLEALPPELQQGLKAGRIHLDDPRTTVTLLKLNAVVGLVGSVETSHGQDVLRRVGVTCALCHSTVDDSFMPGIGRRLDGRPNRDLDPGAIIALSPALDAARKAGYKAWGKGRHDPRFELDGRNGPVPIPPDDGLYGIHSVTFQPRGLELAPAEIAGLAAYLQSL